MQSVPIEQRSGFVELNEDITHSPLYNADLAPTTLAQRKWSVFSIAALWISMSACITTYTLASSLITNGMNWWEAVLTIFLGNAIVLIPMVLNAHAGTKYGIPFPVYCRASFGTSGANVPAMLRALVACGWFGIQTWIGGTALLAVAAAFFPSVVSADHAKVLGITGPEFLAFMIFWGINMIVIYAGINSIRMLLNVKAPLLILLGLLLLGWAYNRAGGFGPMMSQPSAFAPGQPQAGHFWGFFFPALTGVVGYWATLSLNIPDFTRYARSQRDQVLGQALGLPTTMALYSFIGVAVTSATIVIFGHAIWEPVALLSTFHSKITIVIAMGSIAVATLATNIAANVVSPANDFAHLAPKAISFRIGGFITGVIGIVMMPWKLYADPHGYIFTWLIAYSALLGAIGGILICDYFLLRRTHLRLAELFNPKGAYTYANGTNYRAVIALVLAVLPCLPGFLHVVNIVHAVPAILDQIYTYAWFVTFFLAFVIYFVLMIGYENVNEEFSHE
ncbi:MAG TPA: NCS1 family nucleobase:cation symporter-1 [Tepidisphaeraceae bacterium]|jgi:NCS1 family nucleobase:cation symporter-1|nr:NCS1 family nucleobase:cation symporter-1 [Tepidisphaeraceae bacterium]